MPKVITLTGMRLAATPPEMSELAVTPEEEDKPSRLLNYGIVGGIFAAVGLAVGVKNSKRWSVRLAGAGIGALCGVALLAMTWPKELPPA